MHPKDLKKQEQAKHKVKVRKGIVVRTAEIKKIETEN